MWKVLSETVEGSSHRRSGDPCQDYCIAKELQLASETVLVLVGADGAGSAAYGAVGAQQTCTVMSDLVGAWLRSCERLTEITTERASQWLQGLREGLANEAAGRQTEIRELASTLLLAVVGESAAAFLQLGDGVLVTWEDDGYEHVFWPRSGEYVNMTHFVTDAHPEEAMEFLWCPRRIDEVALLTDGLQRLVLDYQTLSVHAPFFAPMFRPLRACTDPAGLSPALRSFLESPRIESRTDDDKTLILATRLDENDHVL
jgi:hypothetical protein